MNKAALFTVLVFGLSSSVALAKVRDTQSPPTRTTFNPNQSNVMLNSDSSEYIGPIYSKHASTGWAILTDPTHIANSRQIIRVSGLFNGGLMLQNVKGSSQIKMVNVRFADGRTQTIKLDQSLSSAQSVIRLAVQRGELDYIVVYGTTNVGGTYRVLGS